MPRPLPSACGMHSRHTPSAERAVTPSRRHPDESQDPEPRTVRLVPLAPDFRQDDGMVTRGRDRCSTHFDPAYPVGPAVGRRSIMAKARYSAAPQPCRADTFAPRYEAPIPPHLPRLRPSRRTSACRRRRIPVAPEVAAYRDRRQHSPGPCADDRPSDGPHARADVRPCARAQGRARSHITPPTSRNSRARTRTRTPTPTPTRAQARSATDRRRRSQSRPVAARGRSAAAARRACTQIPDRAFSRRHSNRRRPP